MHTKRSTQLSLNSNQIFTHAKSIVICTIGLNSTIIINDVINCMSGEPIVESPKKEEKQG